MRDAVRKTTGYGIGEKFSRAENAPGGKKKGNTEKARNTTVTKDNALREWEKEYAEFLNPLGIASLRSLGRFVGVPQATTRKKGELAEWILNIATGKTAPVEKSRRGAPVKEDFVDPVILEKLEELNFSRAAIEAEYTEEDSSERGGDILPEEKNKEGDFLLRSSGERKEAYYEKTVYGGELTMLGGAFCINVADPREYFGRKAVISGKKVKESGARTGDRVTFHGNERLGFLTATDVLSVNAVTAGSGAADFDRAEAEYSCEKLLPLSAEENDSRYMQSGVNGEAKEGGGISAAESGNNPVFKYFRMLYPVGRGQRVLIAGAPKSGKSTLLKALAAAIKRETPEIRLVAALCEQPPEAIGEWQRAFPSTEIYVSGYADEADEHVSQAEKALARAKEYVCGGSEAVLLVDDLNALARAYNETDASAGGRTLDGGIESKTVHYMKKFLGTARKLKSGASLTIFGVLSTDTGAPFDAALGRELLAVSSAAWQLSGNFRRGQSALPDYAASHADGEEKFLSEEEQEMLSDLFAVGAQHVFENGREGILEESRTPQEFLNAVKHAALNDF